MKRLESVLDVVYDKVVYKDWDNVWTLDGDEGIGKSNLGLWIVDWWFTRLYGECKDYNVRNISLDKRGFARSIKDVKQFEILDYDESGELSNKRQMDKFNYLITQGYQVIRGHNLFTILTLPSVFDLNPFFTKRRARGHIHVYERGKFAFWSKEKLRAIIDVNAYAKRKSVWRVKPLFVDTFPKYDGVLKKPYDELKKKKMDALRQKLYDKINEEESVSKEVLWMSRAKNLVGMDTTTKIFDVSERTIYRKLEAYKDGILA